MAINYPGPYEVEYEYLVQGFKHKLRVNCNLQGAPAIGTPTNMIQVYKKDGGTQALNTAIATLWGFLRPMLKTDVTAAAPQVYRYDTGTFAKTWITQEATALANGSSTGTTTLAGQTIFTFRTGNGGIAKIGTLEGVNIGTGRVPLTANSAGTAQQRLAAYLISADSWILGRDDAFLVAPLFWQDGQNEALFRKRYRA